MLKFTKTDKSRELDGVTATYYDGADGSIDLVIARTDGNPHYEATLTRLMAPHKKKMERGKSMSNAEAKKIMNEVYAKEILLGWDETKLLNDNGKPVPYSVESAIELLENDNDLREFVVEFSADINNFLIDKK